MGTNFYVRGWRGRDRMDPKHHIGKRSAAGLYCWDCGVTLCKYGPEKIHYGCHHGPFCNCGWYNKCPNCGKKPIKEGIGDGAVGRELGFNKEIPAKKTGVASCSSFTWAMDPKEFLKRKVIIWNEYGDTFTKKEFLQILEECPIQYKDSIGEWFS